MKVSTAARSRAGQSMVEYAIGLGCVVALCMIFLGQLGHVLGQHLIPNIVGAFNQTTEPRSPHGDFTNPEGKPWLIEH